LNFLQLTFGIIWAKDEKVFELFQKD